MTREQAIKILNKYDLNFCDIDGNPIPPQDLADAFDMAIKALEQEPSEDLISRKDALDEMGYCQTYLFDTRDKDKKISLEDVLYALEQLPSADRPKWIPVTERLPKRDELVLVTYKTSYKIDLCKYLDDGSENPWWSYMEGCMWNDDIIAWQPLPEPYEEAEQ